MPQQMYSDEVKHRIMDLIPILGQAVASIVYRWLRKAKTQSGSIECITRIKITMK